MEEGKKRKGRKLSYSARTGGVSADLSSAAGIMASGLTATANPVTLLPPTLSSNECLTLKGQSTERV